MKSNKLPDSSITVIDALNTGGSPLIQEMRDQLDVKYPEAVKACLKQGGEFCHVCEPDEVNLHLQVHLQHIKYQCYPLLLL